MNVIYRCDLHTLAVSKAVIELFDIRFLYHLDSVLPEVRCDNKVIHIDVVLKCAVLNSALGIFPKLKQVIKCQQLIFLLYTVVLINNYELFFFAQFFKRRSVYIMPFALRVCPPIHICSVRSLGLTCIQPHSIAIHSFCS